MNEHDDLARALGRSLDTIPVGDPDAALARVTARSRVVRRRRVAVRVGAAVAAAAVVLAVWLGARPPGTTQVDTVDTPSIATTPRTGTDGTSPSTPVTTGGPASTVATSVTAAVPTNAPTAPSAPPPSAATLPPSATTAAPPTAAPSRTSSSATAARSSMAKSSWSSLRKTKRKLKPQMDADAAPHKQDVLEGSDRGPACFDKLGMRDFLSAIKILPHPELVEGRTADLQARAKRICVHLRSSAVSIFSASGSLSAHV